MAQRPIPTLLRNGCVILGKLLDVSEPLFPLLKMGVMILVMLT